MKALVLGLTLVLSLPLLGGCLALEPRHQPEPQRLRNHPQTRFCLVGNDQYFRIVDTALEDDDLFVFISRDGDDVVDMVERYKITEKGISPFPVEFRITDFNDEYVDHVVLDVKGEGRCEDLVQIDNKQPQLKA
jgi:hypothetical protein